MSRGSYGSHTRVIGKNSFVYLTFQRPINSLSTLHPPPSTFQLTVANIIAPVIIRLLGLEEGLAQTLAPNGVLIVSGILAEQTGDVTAALNRAGLTVIDQRQIGDWVAMAARPLQ